MALPLSRARHRVTGSAAVVRKAEPFLVRVLTPNGAAEAAAVALPGPVAVWVAVANSEHQAAAAQDVHQGAAGPVEFGVVIPPVAVALKIRRVLAGIMVAETGVAAVMRRAQVEPVGALGPVAVAVVVEMAETGDEVKRESGPSSLSY